MTFTLEMNGAHGHCKAHVNTPSETEEDVFITELDDEMSSVRFLPKENGVYYVHIKFNEAHIPHSPLPILVGKMGADPALVFAKGDGLEKAEAGQFLQSYSSVKRVRSCRLMFTPNTTRSH